MKDVIIIGSGISGLACAYRLKKLGRDVLLIDSNSSVGGVIKSSTNNGFLFEHGPNSFQDTDLIKELIDDLGITNEVITADGNAPRYVYFKNKLHLAPRTPLAFLKSGLISPLAKLRILAEPFISRNPIENEQTVEYFVTRRLGKQLHDALVDPFVSGIYAGNTSKLSANAASPFRKLTELEARYGSIFRGMLNLRKLRKQNSSTSSNSTICSFRNGMKTLPQILGKALINESLLNCSVKNIKSHKTHFTLTIEFNGDHQSISTTSLILATPAFSSAKILGEMSEQLSKTLLQISYPPLVVVGLAYDNKQFESIPNGFGFLSPRSQGLRTLGCIWNSSIFSNRAPDGCQALTTFIGGTTDTSVLSLEDSEIIQIINQDLQKVMKITGSPKILGISRWQHSIPQYNLGYLELIRTIKTLTEYNPGLYLTGNYLYGVSIGDCIEYSYQVAKEVDEYLDYTIQLRSILEQSSKIRSDLHF